MVEPKTKIKSTVERIEFARVYSAKILPHVAGESFPPYPPGELYFQERVVPSRIGTLLRELSRRGRCGVHISKIDHDDLAELELLGIPFKITDWTKTNTWGKQLFVIIDVVLRFAEDRQPA